MDLKEPGNLLYVVGLTGDEPWSHFALIQYLSGGEFPRSIRRGPRKPSRRFTRHRRRPGPRCHDLSEGGSVAAAEMASPVAWGEQFDEALHPTQAMQPLLFSESNTRFLCEVRPENAAVPVALATIPHARLGEVTDNTCWKSCRQRHAHSADLALWPGKAAAVVSRLNGMVAEKGRKGGHYLEQSKTNER
jgi:hypothetical protein